MTLEMLLDERQVPEMPSGLSARIIEEARLTPQDTVVRSSSHSAGTGVQAVSTQDIFSFRQWWHDFWDGFAIPHPALVMSLVLVAGIMIGTYTDPVSTSDTVLDEATSYQLVLTEEADLDIESWL